MKSTDPLIIVEEHFDISREALWSSITDLQEMREWYFDNIPEFKAELGFRTEFNVKAPSRDFLHQWEVTEVVEGERLSYSWQFPGIAGMSISTFEIMANDHGLTLRLTNDVKDDFPQDIPEFKRESCIGGWEYFIKDRLKNYHKKK